MRKGAIWISSLAFLAMVIVNILSEVLPIGGVTNAQVSEMYTSLFTPAGFTFSIWSAIYILLGLFVIRQLAARYRIDNGKAYGLFTISSLLNIAWIYSWHYQLMLLSLVLILSLLVVLAWTMRELRFENPLNRAGFSIYYGWISVATVANAFAMWMAVFPEMRGSLIEEVLVVIALIILGIAAIRELHKNDDYLYALAILWSILGIVAEDYLILKSRHLSIIAVATVMIVLVLRVMLKGGKERRYA